MANESQIPSVMNPKDRVLLTLLQVNAAALLLPIKISNTAMFILSGYIVAGGFLKNIRKNISLYPLVSCIAAFYLMHIFWLINSDNLLSGWKELERKLPLLLMPVAFMSIGSRFIQLYSRRLLMTFSVSTYLACLYLVVMALVRYYHTNDAAVFYYIELGSALNMNPVYIAVYLLLSYAILMLEYTGIKSYLSVSVAFTITLAFLILLSSKSALVIFLFFNMYLIFARVSLLRHKIAFAVFMIILVAGFISASSTTRERIKDLFNSNFSGILENNYTANATTYTGITQRFSFWKVSMSELFASDSYWLGVGTGDQKEFLNSAYQKYGLLQAGYINFNLHNAYFEIILELGLVGFVVFSVWFFIVTRKAIHSHSPLFVFFTILFTVPALTESILNVNKGISFYSYMFCLFLLAKHTTTDPDKLRASGSILFH